MKALHNLVWENELQKFQENNPFVCVGIFSITGEVLFRNKGFTVITPSLDASSFINPSFDNLVSSPWSNEKTLIFTGHLTLATKLESNTSIEARVHRKGNQILILGGMNAQEMIEQNKALFELNEEINALQKDLLRKNKSLKTTLEELETANHELNTANEDKDRIMHVIGHDLKGPIRNLAGVIHLLNIYLENGDVNKAKSTVDMLGSIAVASDELLTNLLHWATEGIKSTSFKPETFNLSSTVKKVLGQVGPDARIKSITLQDYVDAKILVAGNKNMTATILRNTLSNALKYTPAGGEVSVSAKPTKEFIEVVIKDSGPGISKSVLDGLLKNQMVKSRMGNQNEKGTGLGLYICQKFVKQQGGSLQIESELDNGTQVYFTIPQGA